MRISVGMRRVNASYSAGIGGRYFDTHDLFLVMASTLDSFRQELNNQSIEVVNHRCIKNNSESMVKTCVLGVLLSEEGKRIEQYMLSWLTKEYEVISIRQPMPGILFEFPALRFAQLYSVENQEPVLYLHTKGSANPNKNQRQVVNMWRHEFVAKKRAYDRRTNQYDLLMPYSGPQNVTWFNGFIATPKAFTSIPPLEIVQDRFFYEGIFKGASINLFCRRLSNIYYFDDTRDNRILLFRDLRCFSGYFTSLSEFLHIIYKLKYRVIDFCHRYHLPPFIRKIIK